MVTLMMTALWCHDVDLCFSRLALQLESKGVVELSIVQDSVTIKMAVKHGKRMRELARNVSAVTIMNLPFFKYFLKLGHS